MHLKREREKREKRERKREIERERTYRPQSLATSTSDGGMASASRPAPCASKSTDSAVVMSASLTSVLPLMSPDILEDTSTLEVVSRSIIFSKR